MGDNDGVVESARFSAIMEMAIDSAGALVVSDNQTMRKVTVADFPAWFSPNWRR